MRWISNGDPPIYVWEGDCWHDQKGKIIYFANLIEKKWENLFQLKFIDFPKKTRVMTKGK